MGTSSGIVLDYFTEAPIPNACVLLYTTTGTSIYSSTNTFPDGTFSINTPSSSSINVCYVPLLKNYNGFSITIPNYETFITLYLKSDFSNQNISGTGVLNFNSSTLITGQHAIDIKANPCYIFVATLGGLDIIDINTFQNIGYVLSSGISCISVNKNYCTDSPILMGSQSSGVLEINMPYNFTTRDFTSLVRVKFSTARGNLSSNTVTCIDQTTDNAYLIGTDVGVDYITISGKKFSYYYGETINTNCCRISDFYDLYYSPEGSGMYAKYGPVASSWNTLDYIVKLSGTGDNPFPLQTNYINDIDIKSVSGSNSIFIATQSGLVYYDENRNDLNLTASGAKLIKNYP
jgi:hypothetical protein